MPSYRFPSSGLYLLCLRPLQLRTTLTGLPSFQFFASAPFLSLTGMLQLRASALIRSKFFRYAKQNCSSYNTMSFRVIPVHVGQCLITGLLGSPLVSREITPSRASVSELIAIILQSETSKITDITTCMKSAKLVCSHFPGNSIQQLHQPGFGSRPSFSRSYNLFPAVVFHFSCPYDCVPTLCL